MFVGPNVRIGDVAPIVSSSKPKVFSDVFDDYVGYLEHSNTLVEKTYQLEKTGGFTGVGTPEGKRFAEERLGAAAIELRDIIYTAWIRSADPAPPPIPRAAEKP